MENQTYEHRKQGKLKGKGLTIVIISFSVLIIVLFPLTAWLTGKLMLEIARTRKSQNSKNVTGISKALEIYGNGSNQSPINDTRMACSTNITVLAQAIQTYLNDFGEYPNCEKWCDLLIENCKVERRFFRCPGAKEGPCNYAINKNITQLGTSAPGDIVLLFETRPGWNQVGGPEILTTQNHEGEGCNVAFSDSIVKFVYAKDIAKLKWKPD